MMPSFNTGNPNGFNILVVVQVSLVLLYLSLILLLCSYHCNAKRDGLVDENPQKFHMFRTNGTIVHWITQDPRASDKWLFNAGGIRVTNH